MLVQRAVHTTQQIKRTKQTNQSLNSVFPTLLEKKNYQTENCHLQWRHNSRSLRIADCLLMIKFSNDNVDHLTSFEHQ